LTESKNQQASTDSSKATIDNG